MKKFLKISALVLSTALMMTSVVACGGDTPSDGDVYVTFNYNYEGAPTPTQVKVESDGSVTPPSNPTRDKYAFDDWYEAATDSDHVDFSYAITKNTTVYAHWNLAFVDVTFDSNGGTEVESQRVAIGGTIVQPPAPEKDNYLFITWCSDSACENEFSFDTQLTDDITLYAKWEESTGDTVNVTYYYNYEGAPGNGVYYVQRMNPGRPLAIASPERATDEYEYIFGGWYTDAECTTEMKRSNKIESDTSIYAKWLKKYVFEAEYVVLEGKIGHGYSGDASGTSLAVKDAFNANASNGWFVTYLFYNGAELEFVIESDREVFDAKINLRLSIEYRDMTLDGENFLILVNDLGVTYRETVLTGAIADTMDVKRAFEDYEMAEGVHLVQGTNTIKLRVNNSVDYGFGTMEALAPTFDCLYVITDADLSWNPVVSNIQR